MDEATRRSYKAALEHAEAELVAHEARGEVLRRTAEALKSLLAPAPSGPAKPRKRAPVRRRKPRKKIVKGKHPPIPVGHFRGMGPTAAYRKFVSDFGMDHPVPSIRDALLAGGVKTKSSTSLLTGLHSVRRRDDMKAQAAERSAEVDGE